MDTLAAVLEHDHFTYAWVNPLAGLAFAVAGSYLGLSAARYARAADTRTGRFRWMLLASLAIGGIGIWMMHFIAMIGFTVTDRDLRYHVGLTAASFALAVLAVGIGLSVAGTRGAGWPRLVSGGLVCGAGVAGMHYTGMAAISTSGTVRYDTDLVLASVAIAVAAATAALRFTAVVDRRGSMAAAASVMSVAVVGMHYTGMAAVRIESSPRTGGAEGIGPLALMLPILLLALVAILGLVLCVLNAPNPDRRDEAAAADDPAVGLANAARP